MKESKGKTITIIISLVILLLIAATISAYFYVEKQLQAKDPSSDEKIVVKIPKGSSVRTIGDILEKENIINNSRIFSFYVKYKNQNNLKAGKYKLSPKMDTEQIIAILKKGKTVSMTPAFSYKL